MCVSDFFVFVMMDVFFDDIKCDWWSGGCKGSTQVSHREKSVVLACTLLLLVGRR